MAVTQIGTVGTAHLEGAGALGSIAATKTGITPGSSILVRVTGADTFAISNVQNGAGLTQTTPVLLFHWVTGTQNMAYFLFVNHPGGTFTFTANFAGAVAFRAIAIIELTPCRFDAGTSASGTSAAPSSGNVTPSVDGAYLVGFCAGDFLPAKAAAWTEILSESVVVTDTEGLAQAVKAAVAATWTMTSGKWGAMVAAFKEIGRLARPVLPRLSRQMAIGLVVAHSFVGKPLPKAAAAAPTLRPRHATVALVRTPLPASRSTVGKRYVPPAAVAPRIETRPIVALVRVLPPITRSRGPSSQAPEAAENRSPRKPTVAQTRLPLPAVRSVTGSALPHAPAGIPPQAIPTSRPIVALVRLPLPSIRTVVGTAFVLGTPIPPPPGPDYYPWPQGGETRTHSSLGSKRRSSISKALHEATEKQDEPTRRKVRKPRKQPPAPDTEALTAAEGLPRAIGRAPIEREPERQTKAEEPYVPRITHTAAGIGFLRGTRHRATYGVLEASAGGGAYIHGERSKPRYGQLEPEGIENPTLEQIMLATTT